MNSLSNTKWLAFRTHKHISTTIGLALFLLCKCSKRVHIMNTTYNERMQMFNKSLTNQVLNTEILSDTLKFDEVMIHNYLKSIARSLLFFQRSEKVLETSFV